MAAVALVLMLMRMAQVGYPPFRFAGAGVELCYTKAVLLLVLDAHKYPFALLSPLSSRCPSLDGWPSPLHSCVALTPCVDLHVFARLFVIHTQLICSGRYAGPRGGFSGEALGVKTTVGGPRSHRFSRAKGLKPCASPTPHFTRDQFRLGRGMSVVEQLRSSAQLSSGKLPGQETGT
eukprot:scpid64161/ scgid30900/ 